jgi:hypothetical protein
MSSASAVTTPEERPVPVHPGAPGALARGAAGWLASLGSTGAVMGLLVQQGTPVAVVLAHLGFLLLTAVLPGTALWRLVHPRGATLVEDVAMGTAVGLAVHVVLAFVLAPLGFARAAWLWSPVVLLVSVFHPAWRRRWTARHPVRTVAWAALAQAAAVVGVAAWVSWTSFARNPVERLDGSGLGVTAAPIQGYIDMPFHQAVAGGIDTVFPLVYPYLFDEPLRYHLFVYHHLASASAVTGVDLTWVVYRLHTLPLVALAVVLSGVLAHRLSGRAAAAPLAAVVVSLSGPVVPLGWMATPFFDPGLVHFATFRSPTQTFGLPLFLATLVAMTALLRSGVRGSFPVLVCFALLAVASGGSKSTFLPVLLCGLLLAVALAVVRRSSPAVPAVLLGIAAGAFGLLAAVMFGGQSGSLAVAPLALLDALPVVASVGGAPSGVAKVVLLALTLASWSSVGVAALLLGRRLVTDPATVAVLGAAVAGLCAALLTQAAGTSQLYFLYSSWPLLGVLSAAGLASAVARRPAAAAGLVLGVLLAGVALVRLVAAADGPVPPATAGFPLIALGRPWGVVVATVLLVGVVVAVVVAEADRRRSPARGDAPEDLCHGRTRDGTPSTGLGPAAVGILVCTTLLVGAGLSVRAGQVAEAAVGLVTDQPVAPEGMVIGTERSRAALHVRRAAAREDVVATNAHCYGPPDACDARHFWVSALTERRVLVEGWAYPEGFRPGRTRTSPFWDQERFAENEAVFAVGDPGSVARLRDRYGVRWLVVDRAFGVEADQLAQSAGLVHEGDDVAVYEIPAP